jgi:hypothetical protein
MRRKAVYQTPDPRFKEQPNICRKSPTQGSKAEPATCQNPRPDANRYFRIRGNFLPGVNQRGRACGRGLSLPSPACRGGREGRGSARWCDIAPRTRRRHRITYNIQHVINIPRNNGKIRGGSHLVMSRLVQAIPIIGRCALPPTLPSRQAGMAGWGRDKPGDDRRELFTSPR